MIYNIARFVRWPNDGDPSQPIVFCVSERARIAPAFREIEGKNIRMRRARVRLVPEEDASLIGCSAAHFARDGHLSLEGARLDSHTLTMGEAPGFARMGGIVEFVRVGKQQRFSINVAAAREADLKVSARLIDLAIRIE